MTNWALQYSGGSGGFLLLHLLLLSDKFYTAFDRNIPLDQIIQEHWNIKSLDQWKNTEIWPAWKITLDARVNVDKIYLTCNPFELNYNTVLKGLVYKKIVIYTDYQSQLLLARCKKANVPFFGRAGQDLKYIKFKKVLKNWKDHYANIKDPSWPKCLSVRHIDRLPKNIQKEILANPYTEYFLNFKYQDPIAYFNNEPVHEPMIPYLESADVVVKLQDLVNSNGKILETLFDIPKINNKQRALLKKWKQHHTNELLTSIGIAP
jgi:hypothetical protein